MLVPVTRAISPRGAAAGAGGVVQRDRRAGGDARGGSRPTWTADKIVTIAFGMLNEHLPDDRLRDPGDVLPGEAGRLVARAGRRPAGSAFAGFTSAAGRSSTTWPAPSPRPDPRCSRWLRRAARRPARGGGFRRATGAHRPHRQIADPPTLTRRSTGGKPMSRRASRAGVPLLGAGTCLPHALRARSGVSTIDTMPGLYARVGTLGLDVAESHTTYLLLVGSVPPAAVILGHRAAGRAGTPPCCYLSLSPKAAPACRVALPAQRFPVLRPGSPGP